jgi:signal transduction histidine kinase
VTDDGKALATARTDAEDRLIAADEPLAGLQLRCGGELPGPIAIPALRDLIVKARIFGFKLARQITASDGHEQVRAWIDIVPLAEGGTQIVIHSWQTGALAAEDVAELTARKAEIDRTVAELVAELDAAQHVLSVESSAPDLADLVRAMRTGQGRPWTDFVAIEGDSHRQPLHWRLLDGANLKITGSNRGWRASLHPRQMPGQEPSGFELLLTAEVPLAVPVKRDPPVRHMPSNAQGLVGRDVAPVLRQPIARIIANAETIRTRLAGPLAEEYSRYAADIAAAGQHLLALVDDLADLEIVEADEFNTAPDRIDLADVARRAAGIMAVRAGERGITIDAPREGETMPAIAEFRRVLQVLLNLVGNAIRYSPDDSQVWIRLEGEGARARAIVCDQGPGMSEQQQAKLFGKFERLGRSDAQGSGLGLYISRRLARAMGGDLTVESAPGQGARFTLDVPADLLALAPKTAQHPDQP